MCVDVKFVITVEQPIEFYTEILKRFRDGQSLVGRRHPKWIVINLLHRLAVSADLGLIA